MMHSLPFFRKLGVLLGVALGTTSAFAQAPLTTSPYRQDFNTLAQTGTANAKTTLPTGWDLVEAGMAADDAYGTSNGSANGGNTYSLGADAAADRAFGSLLSGSLTPTIGAGFVNNTGAPLTFLTIAYQGETWRIGGTNRADRLDFQYSLDATSLTTGTWTDVDALDYSDVSSAATVTGAATAPVQTAAITSTITGLNIAPGATVWIRWNDFNAAGADDAMGIDDFSLAWQAANPNAPTLTLAPTSLTFAAQALATTSASQTYQLSATNLTAPVALAATGPYTVSKDNMTFATSLSYTAAELTTPATVYVRFAPTAAGTATGSIAHTTTGATTKTLALSGSGYDPNTLTFAFDNCTGALSDGWSQYSVQGDQVWACTTFGHDGTDATGKASLPNGVQINGYVSGTGNVANEDWFISPPFNTSTFTYPLLSFWSRVAFNGPPLQLKVSTNYSGAGSPNAAGVTWTDLDVAFPAAGSDTWTQTSGVDLSPYKGQKVFVAFVYYATIDEGARWTLDDISLVNSTAAPAPVVTTTTKSLDFGYQAVNTSAVQTLTVTLRNLTAPVTVAATGPAFQVSKDGTTFGSSVTYTVAEANNTTQTLTVRFRPTASNTNYTGNLALTTTAGTTTTTTTVTLAGNTYNSENTLEVVNWNVEWFGSTAFGPTNEQQQFSNVQTILNSLKADIFGLVEVVDTVKLGTIVKQLPGGGYTYRVSDFGSYADNAQDPDYAGDQKLAFVYKTSIFKNVKISDLFRCTQAENCAGYSPWSSGRFPYVLDADVMLNGTSQHFTFILIHAKANTAPTATSYARRKAAADQLKAELDANYKSKNVVILGDFNDDLDQTITAGITPPVTSYNAFTDDQADYTALTLPLSQAGQRSTVSYNDVIDHVVVTNATVPYYVPGSAAILTGVANLVTNYGNTTTDHYPVQTRYTFGVTTPTRNAVASRQLDVYPNPATSSIRLALPHAGQALHLMVNGVDGRRVVDTTGSLDQLNQRLSQQLSGMAAGVYILQVVSDQQTYTRRFIKQ